MCHPREPVCAGRDGDPDYNYLFHNVYLAWIPAGACPRLRSGAGMTNKFYFIV